ncbi:MAG: hypothetical protein FE78DRAFT_151670, partial [Acidomyces sp. 'richmondensis']
VFEPLTRLNDRSTYRLLIIDSYNSYITARFFAFYIEYAIDLLILLPYSSYALHHLNVSIFLLLKRVLATETDILVRLNSSSI